MMGNFINGTTYDIVGNIFGKGLNGKLIVKFPPESTSPLVGNPPTNSSQSDTLQTTIQ